MYRCFLGLLFTLFCGLADGRISFTLEKAPASDAPPVQNWNTTLEQLLTMTTGMEIGHYQLPEDGSTDPLQLEDTYALLPL